MPVYPVTNKKTGKKYEMPWDGDNPPDKYDVMSWIDEQERPKTLWEKGNEPLSDFPSRMAKKISEPLLQYSGEPNTAKGVTAATDYLRKGASRYGGAFIESLGHVGDYLTSPISAGLMALTAGTSVAGSAGATGLAEGLHGLSRVAGAGQALHGGYKTYEGYEHGDPAEAAGGLIEALTGGMAARSPYARTVSKPNTIPYGPENRPPIEVNPRTARYSAHPEPPDYIDAEFTSGPNRDMVRNPPSRRPGQRLLNKENIPDADFTVDPDVPEPTPDVSAGPPGLPRRGGSSYQRPTTPPPDPVGHKYFQGERGTSDLFGDVDAGPSLPTSFGARSTTARLRNFGRVKDSEGYYGTGSPEPIPDITNPELPVRESPLADIEPPPQEPVKTPVVEPPRTNPFAVADDGDVEFLAHDGNPDAIAEARRRPGLRERLAGLFARIDEKLPGGGDETGAVGPGADPLIKERVRLRAERARARRQGMPPPDSFDAGLADAGPPETRASEEPIDIVRQLLDSLKQSKIVKNEKGVINIPGVNFKLPKFLRERELPTQYEDWIGQRQANRYKYPSDKGARKVANQMANERFRGWLQSMGYINPDNRGGGIGRILDTAPEDLREAIRNYYSNPNKTLKFAADKATLSKNFAMSAGLPYSGVNAHGFNILARSIIGNPKDAMKVGKYLLNPKDAFLRLAGRTGETSAALDFNAMKPTAEWAIKKGLTFTSEGHDINTVGSTNLAGKALQGFLKKQGEMFEDPLFRQILPAVKLKHFNDMVADMVADGLSRDVAGRQSARFVNNLYGGQNWEMLGANRDLQNIARAIVLAPDWLKTNINLGKGASAALLNKNAEAGKQYRQFAAGMLGAYIAADVMNYAVNGEHMFQNDPGHSFDIHIGKSGNRERYFRPFGTAADFLRLPVDVVSSMFQGDLGQGFRVLKNRASIPVSSGVNLLWNENRFGRPIFGKDVYGKQIPLGEQFAGGASEIGNMFMPAYVRAMKDMAVGRVGGEEAVLGGIEAPFRYSNVPRNPRRRRARRRTR